MQGNPPASSGEVASVFTRAAAGFDQGEGVRRFAHFGRRLVETARVAVGAQVLDVATGRGAVLFPAAERVGPSGRVVGIDLAAGMVAATAQEVASRGVPNIELRVMDAEQLDFPDGSFDALLSGFGVMFFPHLSEALAGFRRVLKPGAPIAVSTWAAPVLYAWEMELWRAYGIADRHPSSLMANQLNTPHELGTVLQAAGFTDVEVITETDELVHADEEEWWKRTFGNPITQAALQTLDAATVERFKGEAFQRLQPLRGPSGFAQRVEALFGLARNP
jgi:O-methyltransferase/aklanonic acid methyltransferase